MWKFVISTLFLIAILMVVNRDEWLKSKPVPCTVPITYSVSSFDRRFGLGYEDFLAALHEAESIWETPTKRNLFEYSAENGKLPISLVYDRRQEVTETLKDIQSGVKETESDYRELESKYKSLKASYDSLRVAYDSAVRAFTQKTAEYNSDVEEWNSGPKKSQSQFNILEDERLAINAESDRLRSIETKLSQKAQELNALVDRINSLAKTLNIAADQYNQVGSSRGDTFEGGLYFSNGVSEGINIYEFENRTKLVRILAHEMGHALGLEHVEDNQAIMYMLNLGNSKTATKADLEALDKLCENN